MHEKYPLNAEKITETQILKPLWKAISKDLRKELGQNNFDIWFAALSLGSIKEGEVTLQAPGMMYQVWIEENFKNSLLLVLQKYLEPVTGFRFDFTDSKETLGKKGVPKSKKKRQKTTKLKPKVLVEEISERKLLERGKAAGLVELFRFDNFVPGENSDIARAAAQAVSKEPAKTYQPLFFHSDCGLGKTHLLHAIGWESLRLRPKSKVLFVTGETFANDYINAIQTNSLVAFRKKYREADLLLLDDVQFLARKEGMQREFFHTFNSLNDMRKQIVLAADCPASEITDLEDRLASRFQWGLSAQIHRPGFETRAAILRQKRDDWKMDVSDAVINEIVERVTGNVRIIEGALIRVGMVSTMNDCPVRPEEVAEVIDDLCGDQETTEVGVKEIKEAVAERYGIEVSLINGKKRTARIAEARQVSMYLIRTLTDLSYMEIAATFGKDHGTVMHAFKKIKSRMETSPALKNTVELIKRSLVRGSSSRDSERGRRMSTDDFPSREGEGGNTATMDPEPEDHNEEIPPEWPNPEDS